MGALFDQLKSAGALFIVMYGLTFTFTNFGPNGTTYIIPAEIYPPHIRASFNGISAAFGKLGAAVTSTTFKSIQDSIGLNNLFIVCSVVSVIGFVMTIFFTPSYDPALLVKMQAAVDQAGKDSDKVASASRSSVTSDSLHDANESAGTQLPPLRKTCLGSCWQSIAGAIRRVSVQPRVWPYTHDQDLAEDRVFDYQSVRAGAQAASDSTPTNAKDSDEVQ